MRKRRGEEAVCVIRKRIKQRKREREKGEQTNTVKPLVPLKTVDFSWEKRFNKGRGARFSSLPMRENKKQ